jgi:hypothetical protein
MASFRPVCTHFLAGTCKFGAACTKSHSDAVIPRASRASAVAAGAVNKTTVVVEQVIVAPNAGTPRPRKALAPEPPTVECVLCFDTTGSMYKYLEEVRRELAETIKRLVAKADKHEHRLRLGVIAHGDYCDKQSSYVDKFLPLLDTQGNPEAVKKLLDFVASVGPTGGGDAPECYELALHRAWKDMGWGPKSTRTLVMVGDATPHEVGYACNGYVNHLDWRKELDSLKAKNVKCYAVQAGRGGDPSATAFWKAVGDGGGEGGQHFAVSELATVRGLILGAVCRDMGRAAHDELERELTAEGLMTRELAGVYAVLRRTITTTEVAITTTKLSRGAGGGCGGLLLEAAAGAAGAGGGKAAGAKAGGVKALLSAAFDLDRHTLAPCAHFLAGTCKYGDKCTKPHPKMPHHAAASAAPTVDCSRGARCSFLREGRCTFRHTAAEVAAARRARNVT